MANTNLNGWISLQRKFLTWKFFDDAEAVKLFIYLLLNVAPKKFEYKHTIKKNGIIEERTIELNKGQFITSFRNLENETKIPLGRIQKLLYKFQKFQIIELQSNKYYSIITVLNFEKYQNLESKNFSNVDTQKDTQKDTQNFDEKNTQTNAIDKGIETNEDTQNFDEKNTQKDTQTNTRINNKEINNNRERENAIEIFAEELKKYKTIYNENELQRFFIWWTQKDDKGQMKFQKTKDFDMENRLKLWKNDSVKNNRQRKQENKITPEMVQAARFLLEL